MVMDENNDDGLGGRSRARRKVSEGNVWGERLTALHALQIGEAPLPPEVVSDVQAARIVLSPRARARSLGHVDKLVRGLEDDEIAALDAWLTDPPPVERVIEAWCARLAAEGDPAVEVWVARWPRTDRQRLRTLARNARGGDPARVRALGAALREMSG